jgi:hypothetical protein
MEASADAPIFRGRALGLRIEADRPLLALLPDERGQERTLALRSAEQLPPLPELSERIAELRGAEGELVLTVDRHPELGYLIDAPGHGGHLLSPDGCSAACVPAVGEGWPWHRLFFAQVLPTAAALQGLEVLHASAVAVAGEAIAIVSASGGGKSSVAGHMVAHGAGFVTDDVLALERPNGSLVAHPGGAFVRVDEAELERMPSLGDPLNRADKVDVALQSVSEPIPLGRLVFLERSADAGRISLEPLSPPDPRLLLASTFAFHLTTRERLVAQLDTCAAIARGVPCFRLVVPAAETAAAAAAVLLES